MFSFSQKIRPAKNYYSLAGYEIDSPSKSPNRQFTFTLLLAISSIMSAIPDPSTEYIEMRRPGSSPTKESSATGVEMKILDQENPRPAHNPSHQYSPQPQQQHYADYHKMASELPVDCFEDEYQEGRNFDDDDNEDENQSMAPSITSSVLTADGVHDVTGFYIVCLVILVGDMSRGVFFPSMWALVSELGGTTVTLGYSVAAFSFGRILVSPLFGAWSETYGYTKTLFVSCVILLLGTLLQAQAQNVGRSGYLIFSQTVLGVGSGTLGVTRAFVAEVTAQRNRTTYMAWITAVQYAGFTVTPFVGALFITTLQDVDVQWGYVPSCCCWM